MTKLQRSFAATLALAAGLTACDATTEPGSQDAAAVEDSTAPNHHDGAVGAAESDAAESGAAESGLRDAAEALDATSSDASLADGAALLDAATPDGDSQSDGAAHVTGASPTSTMATAERGNPAHTNSVLDPRLAPPLQPIWSFQPGGASTTSYPLIANGRVYFVYGSNSSTATRQLLAVDEHTGTTLWGPVDLADYLTNGQAYDAERVFTVDSGGTVRAFDAATGAPLWSYVIGTTDAGRPSIGLTVGSPVAYKGLVYVAGTGLLTALDEATGHVSWTAPINAMLGTSPAVTDDGVFVSGECGEISAFDPATGRLLWHHLPTCGNFSGDVAAFDGRLYVTESAVSPAETDVFDANTGALLGSLPCYIAPAFDEGQAYCNQRTPLVAYDLATGAPSWSFMGDGQLNLAPFAVAGTVYVSSDSGAMFGVDQATGATTWSTEADDLGATSLTVGGEGILLTQLYAGQAVVAYQHVFLSDAGAVVGDGGPPTTFVAGKPPLAIALDATNVYWADFAAGAVYEAPKSGLSGGASPVTLWSSTTLYPRGIAVDATNVYVAASDDFQGGTSGIFAAPIAGTGAQTLVTSQSFSSGLMVAGPSLLYWVDGDGASVDTIPKAGGSESALSGVASAALAVDATYLYWSAADGIYRQPFAGGAAQLVGVPVDPLPGAYASSAAAIAVDETNVYYVNNSGIGPGTVGYIPLTGGAATTLANGRPGALNAIAVDDRNVYWVEGSGTIQQGAIAVVPKTGGQVTVLASGLSDPATVAVDSTGVYFPSADGGLGKIAK